MMNNEFIIHGETIQPGQRRVIHLSMPELYDWTPTFLPIHVIRGKYPGPTLCVSAAVHGDELNGIQIIRELLKKPRLKKIHGTLIAIPIVNLYGFLNQDRYLMDRRDLNRSFPGSASGSLAARLAHLLVSEVFSKATHAIDLHSGSLARSNFPQIRANLDSKEVYDLAMAFNAPLVLHAVLRDGSLREYANDNNIPLLVYEAGEALRFDDLAIKTGLNGILKIMEYLQMIPTRKSLLPNVQSEIARTSYWIRANRSGLFRSFKKLGKKVAKGEVIATIGNPTDNEEHEVQSPSTGIIIGKSFSPIIHAGAALFHIATFSELDIIAENIKVLKEIYMDKNDDYHLS